MDYRSLCLHFECGVWMYRTRAVLQVKEDALKTFAESHEVTLEEFQREIVSCAYIYGSIEIVCTLFCKTLNIVNCPCIFYNIKIKYRL